MYNTMESKLNIEVNIESVLKATPQPNSALRNEHGSVTSRNPCVSRRTFYSGGLC